MEELEGARNLLSNYVERFSPTRRQAFVEEYPRSQSPATIWYFLLGLVLPLN